MLPIPGINHCGHPFCVLCMLTTWSGDLYHDVCSCAPLVVSKINKKHHLAADVLLGKSIFQSSASGRWYDRVDFFFKAHQRMWLLRDLTDPPHRTLSRPTLHTGWGSGDQHVIGMRVNCWSRWDLAAVPPGKTAEQSENAVMQIRSEPYW